MSKRKSFVTRKKKTEEESKVCPQLLLRLNCERRNFRKIEKMINWWWIKIKSIIDWSALNCAPHPTWNWFMWCAHRGWFFREIITKQQNVQIEINLITKCFRLRVQASEWWIFAEEFWIAQSLGRQFLPIAVVIVKGERVCRNQKFKFDAFSPLNNLTQI